MVVLAYFSNRDVSGSTFAVGEVDIMIDNQSYYNGALNQDTSWDLADLTIEKFFNFLDIKPGDYGEDTISIHTVREDTYLCVNVTLTSNNENGCNEPEGLVDFSCGTPGADEGELADLTEFMWWADDGDNVFEDDETIISQGPIGLLPLNSPINLTLADSDENIWTGNGGPIAENSVLYIGKAWCYGSLTPQALDQDELSDAWSPADDNDGLGGAGQPEDGGFLCEGESLGNETQTDSLTADVSFLATQAFGNDGYQCGGVCEINVDETLIPDSGFESPEVTTPQNWNIFDSPAGAWTVEWRGDVPATFGPQNRPNPAHLEIHENVLGTAFEGDQYAELDSDWGGPTDGGSGEPASIVIYQDIATVPGKAYQIKFAFAARPNTVASDNRLEVRWGGVVVHDTGNVADPNAGIEWSEITVDVVATSAVTRLSFGDLGTANSLGTFLDDVRLYGEVCN